MALIMKKATFYLPVILMSVIMMASCSKKEIPVTAFELDSATIVVPAQGGQYSVAYQSPSISNAVPEAICPESWVNSFDYSVNGVISFSVNPNEGDQDRSVNVTVLYGDDVATFTISQHNSKKVLASELENSFFTARFCDFDPDRTRFYYMNPNDIGEFYFNPVTQSRYITARQYASAYAAAYNNTYPDSPISTEYALQWEYIEPTQDNGMTGTFYDVRFYEEGGEAKVSISDGTYAPAGNIEVIRVAGTYTYDEATGTITVNDTSNELVENHRTVTIHIERSGDQYKWQITDIPQQEVLADYLEPEDMNQPQLGLTVPNFNSTEFYTVVGNLVITLEYMGETIVEE